MLAHCRDARFVWNLAVEQQRHWQPGRKAPGYIEQAAQLTEARAEYAWLRAGESDRAAAGAAGFRAGHAKLLHRHAPSPDVAQGRCARRVSAGRGQTASRRAAEPPLRSGVGAQGGLGAVSRCRGRCQQGVKSYRVTRDRAGRWHIAFAHIPAPIAGPRDGSVVGIDRGVVVAAALSTGELLHAPSLTRGEAKRLKVLQQRRARAKRGSTRRARTKRAIAKLKAREADRRKDWVEQITTDIARRFEMIRIEALDVRAMIRSARGTVERPGVRVAQKRGLNRAIRRSGWGLLAARLQHKAYGRVEQIPAAYTSQRCSACGHVAPGNRKSQAVFECEACTAGRCNADINAARNIAAGQAVTARGDLADGRSANREPQLATPAA